MKSAFVATCLAVFAFWAGAHAHAQTNPVDVHGSGYIGPWDLLEFSEQWQDETDFSKFDWNTDNRLEAQDLLEILSRWSSRNDVLEVEIPGLSTGARPLQLVRIPSGSFQMGSPNGELNRQTTEGPLHQVQINYDFYLGETEITQAQWQALMGTNPASGWGVGPNYPVYSVSWDEVTESDGFLARLRTMTGLSGFRLPSEAEWEYACRGGTQTRFFFGDSDAIACDDSCGDCDGENLGGQLTDYLWYCGNNQRDGHPAGTKPVGSLAANQFGLVDMHGNVAEWVQDFWHASYTGAPTNGSAWISPTSTFRVFRGGSWNLAARNCRAASRDRELPDRGNFTRGFRVLAPAE